MMTRMIPARRRRLAAGLAAALVFQTVPWPGAAHLPPGARGPHGGQVQILGPHHGELVARDDALTLYLFDHRDRPVDPREASGTALVEAGAERQALAFALRPDGAALVATGSFRATPGLRVAVEITLRPGTRPMRAQFSPIPPP
jgi:hypothetical protein